MHQLKRLCIAAIVLLVAIPVASSIVIDTVGRVSPIAAFALIIAIVASILGYGYLVADRAIAKRRRPRTTADGRERQPYRPDAQ